MLLSGAGPASDLYRLVGELFSPDAAVRGAARDELIAGNDLTIAPALADAVFFNPAGRAETVAVLEHLLGERHGNVFKKWIEAIGRREDIVPAKGYLTFKGRLFAQIDPAFASLLDESAPRTIRAEEIVFGGVKKDGIPALDNPKFVEGATASWMEDDDPVLGVTINGDSRAYPNRILAWHEMANDRFGGRAVSLSYCTLCGSAILYDGRASDGRTYTFGSSGLLYRSNKLMYDRQTNTLWSQLTGEPVMGLLARKGIRLQVLPVTVTTWGEWLALHPKTRVLSLDTGHRRDYGSGVAYRNYSASKETMFPVWKKAPPPLEAKEWVLVVSIDAVRKIYPVDDLASSAIVHDRVGERDIVIASERVYFSGGRRFRREDRWLVDAGSGERFSLTEEALVSSSTTVRLLRAPSYRAYWFGAYAFYPGTEVWQPEQP